MNVLMVGMETAPFAKVGGLADVMGSLPKALYGMGHDVRVVMPCFKMIEQNPAFAVEEIVAPFPIEVREGVTSYAFVKRTFIPVSAPGSAANGPGIPVYLIGSPVTVATKPDENSGFFQDATDSSGLYVYAPEPYVFFARAVLAAIEKIDAAWRPDVIHCNDWHTGLIPVFAKYDYCLHSRAHSAATVFTIHNLAYQGDFDPGEWHKTGLPHSLYSVEGLEFYGRWTFMKGALQYADQVNTVSPTYAREIQTPAYGCGLDGLLQSLSAEGRLCGILNGIDASHFNPATDPCIPAFFSAADPSGKRRCKSGLQKELGLPQNSGPLISVVSRLAEQKGLDLVLEIAESLMATEAQFVLLGTGDPRLERGFTDMQARYPKQTQVRFMFDADLAQRIYAGSDLFLMPSRFEPCGLGQLISLRYGTVPVVRSTGGLADTVTNFDPMNSPDGNGFVFKECTAKALLEAVTRAITIYRSPNQWTRLVHRALESEFGWDDAARHYTALYRQAMKRHHAGYDVETRVA